MARGVKSSATGWHPCLDYLYPFAQAIRDWDSWEMFPRSPLLEASRAILWLSGIGSAYTDPNQADCGYSTLIHFLEMEYSPEHAKVFKERVRKAFYPHGEVMPLLSLQNRLGRALECSRARDYLGHNPDMPFPGHAVEMQHGMSDRMRMDVEETADKMKGLARYLEDLGDLIAARYGDGKPSREVVDAAPKGKRGAPVTTRKMANFANTRRKRKTQVPWKKIFEEWRIKYPEEAASNVEQIRSAWRREYGDKSTSKSG